MHIGGAQIVVMMMVVMRLIMIMMMAISTGNKVSDLFFVLI